LRDRQEIEQPEPANVGSLRFSPALRRWSNVSHIVQQ
jgi:hypothetical protein